MKEIKKILFPTDFSAMATMGYKYCLKLAKQLGASIDVLHVYRSDLSVPVPEKAAQKIIEERKRNAQLKLGAFAHLQKSKQKDLTEGIEIVAHSAVGLPEDVIANYSKSNDIDLILMPTKGEHNIIETLLVVLQRLQLENQIALCWLCQRERNLYPSKTSPTPRI